MAVKFGIASDLLERSYLLNHMAIETRDLLRSRDKFKPIYHSAYHYQNYQGGELPWDTISHKVT